MNHWLELSIQYANQMSYLDDLFTVYPTIPSGIREIQEEAWIIVEEAFKKGDNKKLLRALLSFDLFPIKDSYIAFLKRDLEAINRNPRTVNRICGQLYDMGLPKIYEQCSIPKESNRQIGPMFRRWLQRKALGIKPVDLNTFLSNNEDAILDAGDTTMKSFAKDHLNYNRDKGLDFVARFNKKYVIGEAKFLTDFGGHQNAQFEDAISTIETDTNAIKIGILDGVLFIKGKNKLYKAITEKYSDYNILSALVLRDFLYQL